MFYGVDDSQGFLRCFLSAVVGFCLPHPVLCIRPGFALATKRKSLAFKSQRRALGISSTKRDDLQMLRLAWNLDRFWPVGSDDDLLD